MTNVTMQDIVNLAQNRGFVYRGSEIYGGLANTWDYGPYGSIMKENIRCLWLKEFVQKRTDMIMLDSTILMNSQVWLTSGHVGGFSDPLIDDKNTKERFRADKLLENLIEEHIKLLCFSLNDKTFSETNGETNRTIRNISDIKNPIKLTSLLKNNRFLIEDHNYDENLYKFGILKEDERHIFEIKEGEGGKCEMYSVKCEDETRSKEVATSYLKAYLFLRYGICNIIPESWPLEKQTEVIRGENIVTNPINNPNTGNPGNWSDVKNFNLMFKTHQGVTDSSGAEIYLRPETAQGIFVNFANILRTSRRKIPFGIAQVGKAFRNEITPGNFIFRTREFEQMEIEYFCEPGKDLEEHANWKDYCMDFLTKKLGLKQESLRFRDHEKDELSHYSNATTDIEFMFPFGWGELCGIADRTDFDLKAHMKESREDLSYFDPVNNKKYIPYVIEPSLGLNRLFLAILVDSYTVDEKNTRAYLKLDPKVAPIKVGVLPVVKKLGDLGKKVYDQLSDDFICEYDDAGSIGKRYARFDEIGTPFCVTIDSENHEDGKVTVRFRDSTQQKIVSLSNLNNFIKEGLK